MAEPEIPPHLLKAREDFGYFCELMGKPPPAHMREWYDVFLTGQSNEHLSHIAGPNTTLLSPRGPLDPATLVATPRGWTALAQLEEGDAVFAGDGSITRVTGTVDYPESPCWRVVMSDGTSVICDDSHRWDVRRISTDAKGTWRTVTLQEIRTFVTVGVQGNWRTGVKRIIRQAGAGETPWLDARGHSRYQVPVAGAAEYPPSSLPLDPYLLGALLGDGGISDANSVRLTTADEDIVERCLQVLPEGMTIKPIQGSLYGWSIVSVLGRGKSRNYADRPANQVAHELRKLGLQGKRSWEKGVPSQYLRASREQRVALLQGLMDSDGTERQGKGPRGGLSFCSTSAELIAGVSELVRSLGGLVFPGKSFRGAYRRADGERKECRMAHRIGIRLPASVLPFHCARKALKYEGPASSRSNGGLVRSIVAIEPVADRAVRCISVEHPGESFLTQDYLPVKNSAKSTFVLLLVSWLIGRHALERKLFRVLYVSYTVDVARTKSAAIKNLMRDPLYREIFPCVRLNKVSQGKTSDELWAIDFDFAGIDTRGEDAFTVACAGLKGSIASKRANLVVVDDGIKSAKAIEKLEIRQEMIKNWNQVIAPTMFEGSRAIVLGTRFRADDIFATTFNEKNGWKVVIQAALVYGDTGAVRSYWPEWFSLKYLLRLQTKDPISFAYQYLNQAVSTNELGISPALFVKTNLPEVYESIGIGLDLSSGITERNDWTAFVLAGRLEGNYYVIDAQRLRAMGNIEKLEVLAELLVEWNLVGKTRDDMYYPTASEVTVWPESVAYQKSFEGDFRRVFHQDWGLRNVRVDPVTDVRGDKLAKMRGMMGLLEQGHIRLNRHRDFQVMIDEVVNHGHAAHDDLSDALTLAIKGLERKGPLQIE